MKKRIWIISELFPPDETSTAYIMGEIANSLTDKYKVGVICGPEIYDSNKAVNRDFRINPDIDIFRVKGIKENKNSKISRIRKFLLISWRIYKLAKAKIKKGDLVLMVSNPFPLIILMSCLKKKLDLNLKMLVHDVFPESLYTDIKIPKVLYNISSTIFNKAYKSTDLLIVIGRDMYEIMDKKTQHKTKIVVIENWADINSIYPTDNNNECITIQYAGNIGKAQGVGNFIDCIYFSKNPNLKFDIWGTGNDIENIRHKIENYSLADKVQLKGTYSREEQQYVLNSCDIALVTLIDGMYGLGTPSKSYNIMATGKPILYIGERDTEIWRVVRENNIGYCFEPNNISDVNNFLSNISKTELIEMGRRARNVAETKYSKEIILEKFKQIV